MMQVLKILLLFTIIDIQTSPAYSQAPYQISSCKIVYAFSTGISKGTKTLIFADSGQVEKEEGVAYTDTSAFNKLFDGVTPWKTNMIKTVSHTLIIQTADSVFQVDVDSAVGSSRVRSNFDLSGLMKNKSKRIRHDTLLGRVCDVIDFDGFKIWTWKGLVLKKDFDVHADVPIYEYATSIDEHYIIKDDEFNIPKGIKMN